MKTFLSPLVLRRGQPVVTFVAKERAAPFTTPTEWSYWLGTYYDYDDRFGSGLTSYAAVNRLRISKAAYDALVTESKRQHALYSVRAARRKARR